MTRLLVANDFPPKVGGIQSYLWELVRRLPPDEIVVLTTAHADAAAFDAAQPFRIERVNGAVLWPTRALARRINALADEVFATSLIIDPPMPLGLLHSRLKKPYSVVLHGGVVGQARPPILRQLLAPVLRGARHIITAGQFPADEARRAVGASLPPVTVVPPGVDSTRFHPLDDDARAKARAAFGLPPDALLVGSVSRLVPRKGMDILIEAAARLAPDHPNLVIAIAGSGRDRTRLDRVVARTGAPVRMLGRIDDAQLAPFYGCVDVFAMLCRNRWRGMEQEGFGIVFMEAAACGVPQVAGDSGGAADAVDDGVTGLVVRHPHDVSEVTTAIASLLGDDERRRAMGQAARTRAVEHFDYDQLAARLDEVLP
ncbi:MAG: glycosyltransferase family 4 protein [Actinobacteria bacterium]|nr:glycosyltransferase family 4 protein [Actinomycetota bacterium]